jgi:rhamnose utilization protein RhaD (predicted bifunctional aldolase and dehydrogenase)
VKNFIIDDMRSYQYDPTKSSLTEWDGSANWNDAVRTLNEEECTVAAIAQSIGSNKDFQAFLNLSEAVGSDILKTQGAGGNTSAKFGGVMWVKASGTWLSQAKNRDIMVPVEVEPLVAALRDNDPRAEKATDFVVKELNSSGLRPSIETSFHAALQNPVVAHYHCVNAIALSVLKRREEILSERMAKVSDLTWTTIPYRRPGTPLAREIDAVAGSLPDVLILFNHGIIVCGRDVAEVSDRIRRVSEALACPSRDGGKPDMAALAALAADSDFQPLSDPDSHKTALAAENLEFALGGSLYPDHVIFLGSTVGLLPNGQSTEAFVERCRTDGREVPKLLVAPGKGVLVSKELTPGGLAMARCLAEVVARIPVGETIEYLTPDDVYELTHWEAEQYRQALDRKANGR